MPDLGRKGEAEVTLGGEGPIARRRKSPNAKRIAARVAKFRNAPMRVEGVVALNPGFFQLEAMRAARVAKAKGKRKVKARG